MAVRDAHTLVGYAALGGPGAQVDGLKAVLLSADRATAGTAVYARLVVPATAGRRTRTPAVAGSDRS